MNDTQIKHFLAGFDLAGKRLPNGKLQAYLGESLLDDWPKEVTLGGNTYTLEEVDCGSEGYETALYA